MQYLQVRKFSIFKEMSKSFVACSTLTKQSCDFSLTFWDFVNDDLMTNKFDGVFSEEEEEYEEEEEGEEDDNQANKSEYVFKINFISRLEQHLKHKHKLTKNL